MKSCFRLDFPVKESDGGQHRRSALVQLSRIAVCNLDSYTEPLSKLFQTTPRFKAWLKLFCILIIFSIFSPRPVREPRGETLLSSLACKNHSRRRKVNVLQDKSARLIRCACDAQACHGTFGKMDMKDDLPCWKKPQFLPLLVWVKPKYQDIRSRYFYSFNTYRATLATAVFWDISSDVLVHLISKRDFLEWA